MKTLARAVLYNYQNAIPEMSKPQRIACHLRCMIVKRLLGRDWQWHWQHLLREFGLGEYATAEPRQKTEPPLELPKCST